MSASLSARLARLVPDRFLLLLVTVVAAASLLPARGAAVPALEWATTIAIALLFFLHGARLSREAIVAGLTFWRLHLVVLSSTYLLFPILGLALFHGLAGVLDENLRLGLLFLCLLPSTVQSSIAFTSIAGGNMAAAVCAASGSNLLGVLVTPVLVGFLMHREGAVSLGSVGSIFAQLLLPFVLGHLLRPWIGAFVARHRMLTLSVDRGSILLVVYVAFSEAAERGLWRQIDLADLAILFAANAALLAVVLAVTTAGSRLLGFARRDEVVIVFCGSKKSLASGVPMASVLFPAAAVGAVVLPLMIFHQIQLMVCAVLARRYAARAVQEAQAGGD